MKFFCGSDGSDVTSWRNDSLKKYACLLSIVISSRCLLRVVPLNTHDSTLYWVYPPFAYNVRCLGCVIMGPTYDGVLEIGFIDLRVSVLNISTFLAVSRRAGVIFEKKIMSWWDLISLAVGVS